MIKKLLSVSLMISFGCMNVTFALAEEIFYPYTLYPASESVTNIIENAKKDASTVSFYASDPEKGEYIPRYEIKKDSDIKTFYVMDSLGAEVIVPKMYHYAINCYLNAAMLATAQYYEEKEKKINGNSTKENNAVIGAVADVNAGIANLALGTQNKPKDEYFKNSSLKRFALDPFCYSPIVFKSDRLMLGGQEIPIPKNLSDYFGQGIINQHVIDNVSTIYNSDPTIKTRFIEELSGEEDFYNTYQKKLEQFQGPNSTSNPSVFLRQIIESEFLSYAEFLTQNRDIADKPAMFQLEFENWFNTARNVSYNAPNNKSPLKFPGIADDGIRTTQNITDVTSTAQEIEKARMAKDISLIVFDDFLLTYPEHLMIKKLETEVTKLESSIDKITRIWLTLVNKFPATKDVKKPK